MSDTLSLDGPRRDNAGNLVASVLAARTGVQDYAGYEVGKPSLARVSVFRPEQEVFSRDSMRSFAGAPVTIEHPADPVTPANWKDHAVGEVDQEIVRDGEAVRVPFLLRDADGIAAVEAGKREVSMGYSCDLSFEDGTTPDGQTYQAVQRNIRINHLAIVDRARGGPKLRIGDSEMTTKTITFDGLPLLVTDAAEAAIGKLQAQIGTLTTVKDAAETQVATLTTDKAALEAKVVTLEQAVKDAKPTPQQLRDAGKALMQTAGKAKALGITVTDAMDEPAIMKAVVSAKMGDAAKDWTDAQIAASFAVLGRDVRVADADPLRDAISGVPVSFGDAQAAYEQARANRKTELRDAWRGPAPANAA